MKNENLKSWEFDFILVQIVPIKSLLNGLKWFWDILRQGSIKNFRF